jgi:hypothetical protein
LDAVLGFINSNVVFIGFLWGLAVKYVPALKGIPNSLIPYMNALVALLTGMAGPGVAHAAGGILGGDSFLGHILGAGWTAIQSALIYEIFGRHPANAMGLKKA